MGRGNSHLPSPNEDRHRCQFDLATGISQSPSCVRLCAGAEDATVSKQMASCLLEPSGQRRMQVIKQSHENVLLKAMNLEIEESLQSPERE